MKILHLSDLHGRLPKVEKLPNFDILTLGGDYAPHGATSRYEELESVKVWLEDYFSPWLKSIEKIRKTPIVGISGNHDFIATYPWGDRYLRSLPWTYLRDQSVTIDGLTIYGSPWSTGHPDYPDWAFQRDEKSLERHWQKIDRSADILLTHMPLYGHGDNIGNSHVGSKSLGKYLKDCKNYARPLQAVFCGHIHEMANTSSIEDDIAIINGSCSKSIEPQTVRVQVIELANANISITKHPLYFQKAPVLDEKLGREYYLQRLLSERIR